MLENTQLALIATVHKLYTMVRNSQQWELGEPELNDRGQPVIHNIAQKLGCIRPNSDIDLPVHSVFPEDEAGMIELARQLEEQQQHQKETMKDSDSSYGYGGRNERASSSDLDHSDFEHDYRRAVFGGGNGSGSGSNGMTLSPQSFTTSNDFDFSPSTAGEMESTQQAIFASQSPAQPAYQAWAHPHAPSQPSHMSMQFLQQPGGAAAQMQNNMDMLNQGLLESEFGTIKPHVLSCANPEVMMGMGDPMIYAGYENESMRL